MITDTLRLQLEERNINGHPYSFVQIFINDKNLIEILKEYERLIVTGEDEKYIIGKYDFLAIEELRGSLKEFVQDKKVAILGCDCGISACWPLLVTVEKRGGTVVVWKDFEQPYRNGKSGEKWDYSNLGPFKFGEKEYQKEIKKLL
jgi:hypothetical protein